MIKKWIALLLALVIVLALFAGCVAKDTAAGTTATAPDQTEPSAETGPSA